MHNTFSNMGYLKCSVHCSECGARFFPCEEIFTWDIGGGNAELLCADCFDDRVSELDRFELARLIGSEVLVLD